MPIEAATSDVLTVMGIAMVRDVRSGTAQARADGG